MAVDNIRNEIGYQRENQTNIERAGNWLTDSGSCPAPWRFPASCPPAWRLAKIAAGIILRNSFRWSFSRPDKSRKFLYHGGNTSLGPYSKTIKHELVPKSAVPVAIPVILLTNLMESIKPCRQMPADSVNRRAVITSTPIQESEGISK